MLRWREIPDFSRYQVSERGDVRRHAHKAPKGGGNRCKPGQLLKPVINKDGYVSFCLRCNDGKYKTVPVSQHMANAFLGCRPSPTHWALLRTAQIRMDPKRIRLVVTIEEHEALRTYLLSTTRRFHARMGGVPLMIVEHVETPLLLTEIAKPNDQQASDQELPEP